MIEQIADVFAVVMMAVHGGTAYIAAHRLRKPADPHKKKGSPPVTLIRPLCGREPFDRDTLMSTFLLRYDGKLTIYFCVDDKDDPIIPEIREIMEIWPKVDARLRIG